jgi:hypothetical protein
LTKRLGLTILVNRSQTHKITKIGLYQYPYLPEPTSIPRIQYPHNFISNLASGYILEIYTQSLEGCAGEENRIQKIGACIRYFVIFNCISALYQ